MEFNVSMTCGYDSSTNELCGWGVEIKEYELWKKNLKI